ncbi:hypothetical protein COOONC_00369 [Cooperia oncophora]
MENRREGDVDENSPPQTDVGHIRGVLSEIQASRRNIRSSKELNEDEEKMDTEHDEDSTTEKTDVTDWSSLRASLEAAFGDIGTTKRHIRSGRRELHGTYPS